LRLVLLLALATMLAAYAGYGVLHPDTPAEALAYTVCPFRGEPVVTLATRVAAEDSLPVRRHEEVHAEQCRRLGPWRYRVRNLTSGGRLLLEAPAYCDQLTMPVEYRGWQEQQDTVVKPLATFPRPLFEVNSRQCQQQFLHPRETHRLPHATF
jgi:hypothetical protein